MEHWKLAAKKNIERYIGDVVHDEMTPDEYAEEVYTLAFDGAVDAGASHEAAREIAKNIF